MTNSPASAVFQNIRIHLFQKHSFHFPERRLAGLEQPALPCTPEDGARARRQREGPQETWGIRLGVLRVAAPPVSRATDPLPLCTQLLRPSPLPEYRSHTQHLFSRQLQGLEKACKKSGQQGSVQLWRGFSTHWFPLGVRTPTKTCSPLLYEGVPSCQRQPEQIFLTNLFLIQLLYAYV